MRAALRAKRASGVRRGQAALLEELESRMLLNALTVITHGYEPFSSSRPGWLDAMANAIVADQGPDTSVYTLRVQADSNGNLYVSNFSILSGPGADAATSNGDTVLLLDWASVSGVNVLGNGQSQYSTQSIADLVTPYLEGTAAFDYSAIGITHPLVEASIQLIGHSRGASLVSAIAGDLSTNGILVDQLTTLDPVPVSPDPPITEWANVIFADNYYETNSLTPGSAISGALNVGPLNLPGKYDEGLLGNLVTGGQHQNVELFYEGTIDTSTSAGDGTESVDPSWYASNDVNRLTTGFYYSAMDGGTRPASGLSTAFGGTASRAAITVSGYQWANVTTLSVPLDTIFLGQNFDVTYRYMDTANATSITWYLDTDQNPYNTGGTKIGTSATLDATGLNVIKATQSLSTSLPAGVYYLEAKITDGDSTRYAYTTSLSLQLPPVIAVAGNTLPILAGDTTPLLGDGTDLGSLIPGQTSLTSTFVISDTGAGLLRFLSNTPVTITGTNAKDFVVTQPVLSEDGSTSSFTVEYDPTDLGVSTATIHIASNDPANPDFTFVVQGTNPPYLDFDVTLGKTNLPANTISGNGAKLTLPLTVKNLGNSTVPSNAPLTTIQIYAHNTANGTETLVTTVSGVNLRGLGKNQSRGLSVSAILPLGFADGNYTFHAVLNSDDDITETSYANNDVTTTQSVNVTAGFYDLTGWIASTSIPIALVEDTSLTKTITIVVQNLGNVALPSNQSVTFAVTAQASGGGSVSLPTTGTYGVGGLGAGKTKTFTLTMKQPAGVPAGTYQLQVQMTPTPTLDESNTSNDLLTGNASGTPIGFVSAPPYVNLTATLGTTKFTTTTIISGSSTKLSIPLTIRNVGNIAVPSNAALTTIEIFAHNLADDTETLATTISNVNLRNLGANSSKSMTLSTTLPLVLATGDYTFDVVVNPNATIVESSPVDNNELTTQSVTVTGGFYDLSGTFSSTTLPPAVINGAAINKTINVLVANLGNLALPSKEQVTFTVILDGSDPVNEIDLTPSSAMSVGGLGANKTKTLTVPIKIPLGLDTNQYQLSIQMNPVQAIPEDNTDNNLISLNAIGNPLNLNSAPAFFNIGGTLTKTSLNATVAPLAAINGNLQLQIENLSNQNLPSGQKVTLQVIAFDTDTDSTTPLSSVVTESVGSWHSGQTGNYTIQVKDPAGLALDQYNLEVIITPVQPLVEVDPNGNIVSLTPHGDPISITIT